MTVNAKTALAALRDSDHPFGRPLTLCLMFEPAKDQCLAASIFHLAIALDSALHIPSESLLAAIRVQWWVDAFRSGALQQTMMDARRPCRPVQAPPFQVQPLDTSPFDL